MGIVLAKARMGACRKCGKIQYVLHVSCRHIIENFRNGHHVGGNTAIFVSIFSLIPIKAGSGYPFLA